MIRRSTWITIGIFAVLLAGALWWTRSRPVGENVDVTPTPRPLWEVGVKDVEGLRVEDVANGQVVELRRDQEFGWRLVIPQEGPADATRAEIAASWARAPQPLAVIRDVEDPSAFGFSPPAYRITVYLRDGRAQTIEVGRESPTGSMRYIRVPEISGVMTVSSFGIADVIGLVDPIPLAAAEPTDIPESSKTPEPSSAGGTPAP